MRKLLWVIAALVMVVATLPGAAAGPTPGGMASDNVEYVGYIPFEVGTATGANFFGTPKQRYMVTTSWRSFSLYDITDPESPALLSQTPFGFKFENEDVGTNGEIMLFSEQLPQNNLHIWNIEDKTNPVKIAEVPGGGGHTSSCLLDCKWSWASGGAIVDLRDPENPKLLKEKWTDGMPATSSHDVEEIAPGLVLTDSEPIMLLDARKNPAKPKLLALGETDAFIHSIKWPRLGKDKYFMSAGETNARTRCNDTAGAFSTWDTTGWKKTRTFKMVDQFRVQNGTGADGSPPVNGLGCSSHWFNAHDSFHNGGLVAGGFYEHGTRFLDISSKGKIKEVGYFMPFGGSTSAAYWVTKDLVYAVDYSRGIDILRWTDKV